MYKCINVQLLKKIRFKRLIYNNNKKWEFVA